MLPNSLEYVFQQVSERISIVEASVKRIVVQRERSEVTGGVVSSTVANLPSTNNTGGDMFFASNGLKVGETTGNGTGTLVYWNAATSQWFRVRDDSLVQT